MTLQTSGNICIGDLKTEFGSSANCLTSYYRGGGIVPDSSTNSGVPTSGNICLTDFYGAANAIAMNVTPVQAIRYSSAGIGAFVEDVVIESDGDADAVAQIDFVYQLYQPFFYAARGAVKAARAYSTRQVWDSFGTVSTLSNTTYTSAASSFVDPAGNNLTVTPYNGPDYFKIKWTSSTTQSGVGGGTVSAINYATNGGSTRSSLLGGSPGYTNGITNDTWIAHPTTTNNTPQYGITFNSGASVLNFSSTSVTKIVDTTWTVEVWWRKSGFFDTKIFEHKYETRAQATAYTSGGPIP